MGLCVPWSDSFIHNWKNYKNSENKTKMTFCWKALDPSQNNCEGLTQWAFFAPYADTYLHNFKLE